MRNLLLALLVAMSIGACSAPNEDSDASASEASRMARDFETGKEARAWLATGRNHMFEASDQVCREVIEDLYRAGALEVRVIDGSKTEDGSGEIASTLMAKLPGDAAKRKALFDYEADHTEDAEAGTERDYVEIVFD
jgi:hypothetical protein